jgi:hypothetical protein
MYLRDLPQQKSPSAFCWGSYPNFTCSQVLMKFVFFTKWERSEEIKGFRVYLRGGSSTCALSWGLGTTWGALPPENALQEPPLQRNTQSSSNFKAIYTWWRFLKMWDWNENYIIACPLSISRAQKTFRPTSLSFPCVWASNPSKSQYKINLASMVTLGHLQQCSVCDYRQ